MNSTDRHLKSNFQIEDEILQAIRSGNDRLRSICKAWIRPFSTGLSKEEREDVVAEAIASAMPAMLSPQYDAAAVSEILRKELQRLQSSSRRHSFKMKDFEESEQGRSEVSPVEEEQIATEHILDMARIGRKLIAKAIDLLEDRDHDLLVEVYGLASIGFPRRSDAPLSFPTEGARITALSRARTSFSRLLEAMLDAAQTTLGLDPHIVEQMLRFVRGKDRNHPLIALSDLENQARDRYSALVEKKYAASLTEVEREEMLLIEEFLDRSEAEFYEPIENKLESALTRLRQQAKR